MDRFIEIADDRVGDDIIHYKVHACLVPESSLRERITRDMHDSPLEDYSWYEALPMLKLFSREVLRPHGVLENIDGIWVSKYLDVVWRELIRLAGVESILVTWVPLGDFISRVWIIGILMIINIAQ